MSEQIVNVIAIVLVALAPVLAALAAKVVGKVCAYLDAKTSVWDGEADIKKKEALGLRVRDAAAAAALEIQLTFVNTAKTLAKDGKLTKKEAGIAMKKAVASAGQKLLAEGLELKDDMLPLAIEMAVSTLKQRLPGIFGNPKAEALAAEARGKAAVAVMKPKLVE